MSETNDSKDMETIIDQNLEADLEQLDVNTSPQTDPEITQEDVMQEEASEDAQDDVDFSVIEDDLLALQQEIRALKIPVVILFEGWAASGKGTMAGELLEGLDPRGYKVHVAERFDAEDNDYLPLKNYWTRMPAKGDISLFIGSWYHNLCARSVHSKSERKAFARHIEHLNQMELMLACDGVLILKFFINIPRKEQKKRLKELASKKLTQKLVSKADVSQNENYDLWQSQYNHMLAATNDECAVWHILRGENKSECKKQMYEIVTDAFKRVIQQRKDNEQPWDTPELPLHTMLRTLPTPLLSDIDPEQIFEGDYKEELKVAQKKLRKLQYELYRSNIPVVLAFEGWDAAGKGGTIRRLSNALDPRGFSVVPIASPTADEKAHHHLWRFWKTLPEKGQITIYDRTWYGRLMVERIEGYCTEAQWQRSYEEINLFERDIVSSDAVLLKFWMHISPDVQLQRFNERQENPQKQWKITDDDWRNRDKRPLYEQAINDMLQRTNTRRAPWMVVQANDKHYARLKVINAVIDAIETALKHK
ncbi:MAG: polyphosphate:AMP phosphotransferase [Clostridiales bacterium]|nr:polyphosphate:AMP phosphotransferase [Clostridiales bacterium]